MRPSATGLAVAAALLVACAESANFCDLIVCPYDVAPVCASDGISYGNGCLFEIAKCNDDSLEITSTGECEDPADAPQDPTMPSVVPRPIAACDSSCIASYEPVCGSDGVTYTNRCELKQADCESRRVKASAKITVASEGRCATAAVEITPVTEVLADGNTTTVETTGASIATKPSA